MRKFLLLFLLIASFARVDLRAQKITVNARLDSTVIWIGSQTHLTFQVSQQPKQKVVMPVFSDNIVAGLETVEPVKTDTVKSPDGHLLVNQHYVVTSFKDSLIYIPPFPFVLNGDTVWSKSLSLKVVQPFKIDTASNKIADIKSVLSPKFDWKSFLLTVLLIVVIIGLLVLMYFIYKKYFMKKPVLNDKEIRLLLPPHVVALNQLDKVKQEKSWQQGRSKEFHTQLTDILREYIERVFNISSMEMTSDEILEQLRGLKLEQKATYLSLEQILKLADLVKFAKWDAMPDEEPKPLAELKAEELNETK